MGADHRRRVADGDIDEGGVRADVAVAADHGGRVQLGAGGDGRVLADVDVDVDPGARWVDDGDAVALMVADDPPVQFGTELGELHAIVYPGHECAVVNMIGVHHFPLSRMMDTASVR